MSLNATNAAGSNISTKTGYITVTEPATVVNGTIIQQGATVFIGEGGLDITLALTQANEQTGTTGLRLSDGGLQQKIVSYFAYQQYL